MICPMNTSQPFSPATPTIVQWTNERSGHGGKNGGEAWAQQHGLPLTKDDLATAMLSAQSTSSMNQY